MRKLLLAGLAIVAAGCSAVDRDFMPGVFAPGDLDSTVFFLRSTLGPSSQDVMTEESLRDGATAVDGARPMKWPGELSDTWIRSEENVGQVIAQLRRSSERAGLPETTARFRTLERATGMSDREKLESARGIANAAGGEVQAALAEVRSRTPFVRPFTWRCREALDILVDSNNAVDLVALDHEGLGFLKALYPSASVRKDQVRRLIARLPPGTQPFNHNGSDGFHFDDLFTFDTIVRRWAALESWARFQAAESQKEWGASGRRDFICAMGVLLHATQDFYQHSNWVAVLMRFIDSEEPVDFPLWSDVMPSGFVSEDDLRRVEAIREMGRLLGSDDPLPARAELLAEFRKSNRETSEEKKEGGLQTGAWYREVARDPATGKKVEPWSHDHANILTTERKLVHELGQRETAHTIQMMLSFLDEAHRADLIEWLERPDYLD